MSHLITELHYFPCIAYFSAILQAQSLTFEAQEHYTKQSYRNRCYILGANQVERLTVPVVSPSGVKIPIREVQIDNRQRWQTVHWRTILAAYNKSPYFMYYLHLFEPIFQQKHTHLFDLNKEIFDRLALILEINLPITYTTHYQAQYDQQLYQDNRNKENIANDQKKYTQVFGNQFVSNLSILDLISCKGNQARNFL
jgi:WbqC-like protein family